MLTSEQLRRLQAFADQKSGDPHLDAMKAQVVKDIKKDRLKNDHGKA